MSTNDQNISVTEDQLHAYADGLLPADQVKTVQTYLAANPTRAAEVDDWKRQNAAMAALFPRSEAELRTRAMPQTSQGRASVTLIRIAAALALLGVGAASGWYTRGGFEQSVTTMQVSLVNEAVAAHALYASEVLHPVEVTADQADHLVGWLSKRLGANISAPDLTASGYQLVGGRLLPSGDGPAAQFMYEDTKGRRITIYAITGSPGVLASFQFKTRDGLSSIVWQDQSLRYAVVGPLERDELTKIATEVYRQLI